jgi:hypothetical protein
VRITESQLRRIIAEEIKAVQQERDIVNVHAGHAETPHSKVVVNLIKGNTSLLKALKDITSQQDLTALLQAIDDLTGVKERTTMMRSLSKVTTHQKKG